METFSVSRFPGCLDLLLATPTSHWRIMSKNCWPDGSGIQFHAFICESGLRPGAPYGARGEFNPQKVAYELGRLELCYGFFGSTLDCILWETCAFESKANYYYLVNARGKKPFLGIKRFQQLNFYVYTAICMWNKSNAKRRCTPIRPRHELWVKVGQEPGNSRNSR